MFHANMAALRMQAAHPAWFGWIVGLTAIVVATALTVLLGSKPLSLAAMVWAQTSNPALWLLDLMPFAIALWGQNLSALVPRQVSPQRTTQAQGLGAFGNAGHSERQASGLTAELRRAIDDDQLQLFLQPIVACNSGCVVGAEALIRWRHPRRGLLLPDAFIPQAERSGLIVDLTRWVLRDALRHARALDRAGWSLRVSVNISARSLQDAEFPDLLADLLAANAVPADRLILEITEDTVMSDEPCARAVVAQVVGLGVGFAIDDFGTGYSQLSYLRRLPVSRIKIDRCFVQDMLSSSKDLSIVRASIGLARNLALQVVAEGVEKAEQLRKLEAMDCDMVQGFHTGRPMPKNAFVAWLGQRDRFVNEAAREHRGLVYGFAHWFRRARDGRTLR